MEQDAKDRLLVGFGAFLTVWIAAALACAVVVHMQLGHWIELFNGATWPTIFTPPPPQVGAAAVSGQAAGTLNAYGAWFYIVLAFRTIVNLGAVLTGTLALVWLVTGELKRWVMDQIDKAVRDLAHTQLLAQVVHALQAAQIPLTERQEEVAFGVAKDFEQTKSGQAYEQLVREVNSGAH